jgi:hypothetical protein
MIVQTERLPSSHTFYTPYHTPQRERIDAFASTQAPRPRHQPKEGERLIIDLRIELHLEWPVAVCRKEHGYEWL